MVFVLGPGGNVTVLTQAAIEMMSLLCDGKSALPAHFIREVLHPLEIGPAVVQLPAVYE